MLDSLLDDLNSARRSYDHPDHASCNSASTLPSNRRSAHSPTSNGYASLHRHNRSPSPGMYNTSTTTTLIYTSSSLLFLFLPICTCVFPLFAVAQLAKLYEYLNRGGVSLASAITLCEYSHQRVKCVRVVTGSIKGSTRASFFFACLLSCYGRPISRLDEEENPLCPATAPFRPCLSLDSVCDHRHWHSLPVPQAIQFTQTATSLNGHLQELSLCGLLLLIVFPVELSFVVSAADCLLQAHTFSQLPLFETSETSTYFESISFDFYYHRLVCTPHILFLTNWVLNMITFQGE